MKHLMNNTNKGELAPWVTLDSEGVHYSCGVEEVPLIEVVDLGLPSGTKWMKYNIGANSETEYGLLFQWGATEGHDYDIDAKNYSTWSTAPFNNGSSDYDSTYFESVKDTVCPNGVLASQYDAVYQATNGVAHMPTQADFNELTANTTVEWTSMTASGGSTVYGRKFTASNGNYIFIPASGYADNGSVSSRGSRGTVWSSSLSADYPSLAWSLYFISSYVGVSFYNRYYGCSVRGVVSKN